MVVSYNVSALLGACLRSLLAQDDVELESVVVDNASSDGSAEMVERDFSRVRLIRNPDNRGFATASNQGIRATSGSYLLSLNPDAELQPMALARLASYLDRHPEVGVAGPKILRPDGSLDLAARRTFPSPAVALLRLSLLSRLFPRSSRLARYNLTDRSPDLLQEIDAGTGACLLFRRAALDQVGLFDETFFMYGEDLDLCFRIKAAGWRIMYVPEAVVIHHKGQSSRQQSNAMIREFHRAMRIFFRKHYRASTSAPVAALVYAGIEARSAALLVANSVRRRKRVSR